MYNSENYTYMADPIRHHAKVRGDKAALIFEGQEISYGELDRRASQVANGLIAAGVAPGHRVAILAKNIDLFFEIYYGATKAGAVLVPINYRLAPPEVAYVLNDAETKVLFVTDDYYDLMAGVASDRLAWRP
jgi:acyl-CoA synthetase (AMP-forming)/AMP-acid ligase II